MAGLLVDALPENIRWLRSFRAQQGQEGAGRAVLQLPPWCLLVPVGSLQAQCRGGGVDVL